MHPLIYDVAVSADGFICGANADISSFPQEGAVVDDYLARLDTYAAVLMGRRTYEFGYEFGLAPGANPYPNMRAIVVASGASIPTDNAVEVVADDIPKHVENLKATAGGPVYLCGGGELAGWLCARGVIDKLRLKRAPIFLGRGVRLFGSHETAPHLRLIDERCYSDGVFYQEFDVQR